MARTGQKPPTQLREPAAVAPRRRVLRRLRGIFAAPAFLLYALQPAHPASVESLRPPALTPPAFEQRTTLGAHFERYAMSRVPRDCLDPAKSNNPDIRRHLATIRAARLCYRRETVEEGRFRWMFHLFHHPTERDGPFWLLPHDDENTSFEVAVYAVDTYGGGFLAIDSGQRRRFRGQDPNRNFSRSWSESALCREQASPAPEYTAAVLGHFKAHRKFPYLSLHNNGDRWAGNGGHGTISVYRSLPILRGFPSATAVGDFRDEDNLVFVAGLRPYAQDREAQRKVERLNRLGLNVVHKQVTTRSFNCSLSDFVTRNRLGDYYNVEAQHGRSSVQKAMVDRLMKSLGHRPLRDSTHDGGPFLGGAPPLPTAGG